MKRLVGLAAITVATVALLTGCTAIQSKPEVIHYPTYPEQNVSAPKYDTKAGKATKQISYNSESVQTSTLIPNTTISPDSIPQDLQDSKVFDITPPVENQPFIVKITYRSNKAGYFTGVSSTGDYTDTINSFDSPGTKYAIIGVYGKSQTEGVKVFGDGQWTLDITPISQLPVFNGKKISGTGAKAFLVNGKTVNVLIADDGAGFNLYSYGYQNRVLESNNSGSQNLNTALPGNGTIVIVDYDKPWSITKAKKVVSEEAK
jgi:hypothetical protein